MFKLFAALALSIFYIGAAGASSWPDAYSRREYRLGMSMSEFRAVPFPDQTEWPNAYPVCTNEPKALSDRYQSRSFGGALGAVSPDWKSAGVTKCAFFYDDRDENPMYGAFSAGLVMGNINASTEFFFIPPSQGKEATLFYITSEGPTKYFDDLVLTFAEALGAPVSVKNEKVKNAMGGEFDNTKVVWSNKSSKIIAERYGATVRVLRIQHILKPLWKVLLANLRRDRIERVKKL